MVIMNEITLLCDRLGASIDALQERVHAKKWSDFSRKSFLHSLRSATAELGEVASLLEMAGEEFGLEAAGDAPDVEKHLGEVKALLALLEKNRTMEEDKQDSLKGADDFYEEQFRTPELYASLEQQVLSTLLKTRYIVERLQIYSRKKSGLQPTGRAAQHNLLRLLDEKERELQELKARHEEMRVEALFGKKSADAHETAELEHELNHVARRMEAENAVLNESLSLYRSQVEQLQANYALMEDKVKGIEELSVRHMAKSLELVTLLKKERDYAKKLVLEVQDETTDLRNGYSRALLDLEGEKQGARQQAAETFGKRLSRLERELEDKKKMLDQMHRIVVEKEKRISEIGKKKK